MVALQPLPKQRRRKTVKPLRYYFDDDCVGEYIEVPEGFVFDGATIPYIFGMFFQSVEPRTIGPACMHDYIYRKKGKLCDRTMTLADCDRLFLKQMRIMGVGLVKRYLMFFGVKLGGWVLWYDVDDKIVSVLDRMAKWVDDLF